MEDLKKLLAAATPGPWHVGHNELGDPQGPMSIWPDTSMVGAVIARCGPQRMSQGWFEQPAKDAALIVAAVNALPELLAEVERLEEAFSGPAAWLDRWAQHVGNCKGGDVCTCGLTFVRTEAAAALNQMIALSPYREGAQQWIKR
jgi:hypothetical protein